MILDVPLDVIFLDIGINMKTNSKRINGIVSYVPGLGWVLLSLTTPTAPDAHTTTHHRPRRQYWLVDWSEWHKLESNCQSPQPGIWEAWTGDFTERHHQDWCRPTALIKMYKEDK